MGQLIAPRVWCRQRWCREEAEVEHHLGDGCSCDRHGEPASGVPTRTMLTAKAARLAAFACRACGRNARQMVEYPVLFFRCEPCAAADRWPVFDSRGTHVRG
jgi:hypothetical protein